MKKKEVVPSCKEVLLHKLQADVKSALLLAEALKVEEGPACGTRLKTVIGSLAYLRKLIA